MMVATSVASSSSALSSCLHCLAYILYRYGRKLSVAKSKPNISRFCWYFLLQQGKYHRGRWATDRSGEPQGSHLAHRSTTLRLLQFQQREREIGSKKSLIEIDLARTLELAWTRSVARETPPASLQLACRRPNIGCTGTGTGTGMDELGIGSAPILG
ncbi:hypothetical protein B0T22DRAFT_459776 [Podospora appendiculata]|uniref:Uncharacterized protein n=1 Tax=Podospora appendiculata TaxID=314037 RepID=A0AAE0XA48_9PEZI|nr:hypothetical protein B0T22DRAFT_459776 [Podospora appendiculata]